MTPPTHIGIIRRLQALRALGYTRQQLADTLRCNPQTIRHLTQHGKRPTQRITLATLNHYERLAHQEPPATTTEQRRGRAQARAFALTEGWAPPMAWDNIDDPNAEPTGIRGDVDPPSQIEEILWLLESGESPHHVTTRLGIKHDSLLRTLRRNGETEWAKRCARTA